MNENALNTFYSNIINNDSTFAADYDTFKSGMENPAVRKEVYKKIRQSNPNFPVNDEEIDATLGYQTKFDNVATESTNKAVSALRNEKYASLSDNEIYDKWNKMLSKGEQNKTANIERLKKEEEQFAKQKPFLHALSNAAMQSGPAGDRMQTPIEAIEEKHASTFLDPSDLEEFKALDKERGVRIYESGNPDVKTSTIASVNYIKDIRDRANRDNKKLSARERVDLNMAERINDMSQELIEAPSKFGEESGVVNWGTGLSDKLFDRDIISVIGMVRDWEVSHVVKKLNNEENLTEAENAMIMAVANFDEVQLSRSSDLSVGYQIGQGTAQCVPLIIDMMVTKGLGAAGKRALIKNLDKLVKAGKITQKSVDRFARILNGAKGVTYTTGKGDDAVEVTVGALEEGAKKTFGQYVGDASRELVETGIQTYVMPSSQRQMIQEKTELRRKTGENDIAFKDRARIFGDAYTQTFTERAGGKAIDWALGKVFGMTSVLQKFGYDRGILKLLNDAVQNPVSEIGEEYLGAIINLVRSADLFDIYSKQSNEDLRDEAMSMFTSEGFWQTVGTTLPMSLFGGAANYGAIKAETKRYNKSYLELSQYLQKTGIEKSQAENILRQIESAKDNAEFKERMSILKTYLTNYIMENNHDTEVAKGKLEGMTTLLDTYSNNRDSYEEAIGGLKYALASMSKEAKEKVAEDFKKLVDNANRSITATPQKEGKDITPADNQTAGWAKRKYAVTIDGKKENITIQGELYFNEDGSINSTQTDMGKVHIQNEQGKNIRTTVKADKKKEIFNKYLDAINDELRKQKAQKDAEVIAAQKAEETRKAELARIKAEEKAKVDAENAKLEAEKQVIAELDAEKQTILGNLPKDKQGEVSEKDMKPEQKVLYWQQEDTPEAVLQNLTDQLIWEEQQIADIQSKDMSPADKVSAIRKHKKSIEAYENAIKKWLGQETLDKITAARAEALQPKIDTPPVEEGPAVPPVQETVVAPLQDDVPAEPDTTPLQPAEPAQETIGDEGGVENEEDDEVAGQEREPIDLSSDDVVFVRQDWRVDIARMDENGELRFVDSGKKVGSSWRVMDNKFLVYYNGIPCYALTTVKDVKAFPNSVTIVAQDYTGNRLKVSKWTLKDAEGNKLLKTGAEIQEENIRNNYKSLDDFMNEVVYANPKTGIKLTLGELLAIPAVQTNKGQRGKPVYAFQVEQFLNKNASTEDRAEILRDIRHRISEIAGTWNAYVRINNLTDVVTEDNITDFYKSMKEAGGYKSNGLTIQTQDFGALNSNDITKNPILQMLVMLDQAKELGLFSGSVSMMSVDKLSSIKQGISKASSMSTEDILREMEDIRKDRALKNDNSIASKRFNELGRELKKRTESTDDTDANVETTEERPATSANNDEAEMQLNNLATLRQTRNDAISAGDTATANGIQALITTVEEELKTKGIEYPADVLPTTEQPAAQQAQEVDADALRAEYNRIQSDLNEFVYETDEEIDAANTRLAEIKEQLRSVGEFMVGDIAESSASQEAKELALAAEIQLLTDSEDIEVMDTTAEQIEESTHLMTSNGVVYGYAIGNKIYLTPDGMNTNTPVHEYTHIWAKAMQKHNPKAWKSIVEQLKKADALWNEVVNDPNYENIKGNDDAIASEVLSRYSGKNGAAKLEVDAERVVTEYKGMEKGLKVEALISRVKKALNQFWSWVGKDLFKIESFESVESIADRVLYDMLNNTKLNLDNSKKSSTFAENNENYERTDEFRELQERSVGLSLSRISEFHSERRKLSDEDRRRVGGVFQRLMESERNGGRNSQWINLIGKGNQFKIAQVNPAIFHDIFQICRNYLPNGELVNLHDNYADCKCFISEDGLCGFAIEPNGNLISVFSLNPSNKKGFLYAIKDLIRQEGATHLDCYVSSKQPLAGIYQKALGFHVASEMDYNMEYDHDNIAENHGMPKVAFMVDKPTEKREFDGESYDAAYDYQQSQTSTAEREQIIAESKANGTFMTAPNGQPTNLTEDQWVATRTQAFKDWFGDWQNDPANASKVLDENGEPLVVYHGSRMAGFDKFGRDNARDSQGIYTTPNRRAAESYATSKEEWRSGQTMPEAELGVPDHHGVYSLFVNMRNPKVIDFGGKESDRFGTPKYEVATNEALDNGERGILFDTLEEAEAYIAEHPEEDLDYVEKYTTSDELLVQAKEEGYDGVIFTNIIDSRYRDPITNYVPFESNQVKSATQNIGTFNPEDDRIEFMIGPAAAKETEEKIKKASEDVEEAFVTADVPLPDKTNRLAKLATAVCDSGEAFRQFMKALRKYRKENHLGKLPEGRDIRQIYDNQRVVLKNKIKELFDLYETPLEETLEKLIKVVENSAMYQKYQEDRVVYTIEEEDADGNITTKTVTEYIEITPREFIERYLIACDSVERLNNGIPPRGLREFYSRMGVNVYDFQMEFEAAFASDGEGEALVKELWKRINAYTNYTLEDSYECGMLTEEEYNKRKARKFYVPERDFQAEKELEQTEIKPQKHYRSNKLASSKQAKGGDSLAANIIENMIHIGNIDLSKNNKNRVKLAMFNLLKENEDFRRSIGLPKPEEVWYDSNGKRLSNKPSKTLIERIKWLEAQIAEYDSLIAIEEAQAVPDMAEIAQLEKEMQDLIDERKGIPYMLEYDARDKFFGENNPHMVGVYVDGVLCSMQFPNMGLIATALNDTWADSLAVRDWIKKGTGYLGSIITTYEPTFFTVNTVTDSMAILTKGYVELGLEYSARFIATTKDLGKHMSLITAYMTGKDYRSMENGDLFRDFLMNGGNTGYATIRNMETILKELQVLDNKSNHIKDAKKWLKKALSFTNESAELLLRFAAYKAAIECGYGVEKATWAANNLSANFNRTGKKFNDTNFGWRALGGAMEWFKSLSMFTNPAIQGAMSYLRMFGDSGELSTKERVAKYFRLFNAAMFMPALCGFLNAMMFDDDEQEEWAVSEYDRANYLVLGKLGKWAVPHMLRPFYNIGVNIAMGMQGRRTGGDIADSIITSFLTHLTPLPPVLTETASKGVHSAFGNADFTFFDGIESLVSPQGINTLKELADGENFLGYKVRYEGSTAQYTKNPNAGAFEKIIAEQFYIWGGGIEGSDSKITNNGNTIGRFLDVSPNEMKSLMQLLVPKLVIDVANITAGSISEEHDVRLKDIPVVNRFVSDRTKEAYRAGIYSEANKITKANDMIVKAAKGDIERLKIDLGKASSEEERVRIQGEIDFYEGIYKQAKGDVFAVTIEKNLEKYKRIRMASLYKKYHHDEKSFKKLYPDLRYDVIEDAERMFTFNMFQLVCMYNGTGKVNDNLPNWMKDVFRMKPSTQEVNEMWEHYQKLQEENNERLGLSEQ